MTEIRLESRIVRVDVYRNSALVTRRAHWLPDGGEAQAVLWLPGLPAALRDDSVRAAVPGGGARVSDLYLAWQLAARDAQLRTDAAERLCALQRERIEREIERVRQAARIKFFESLVPVRPPADELPDALAYSPRQPLPGWLALADFVRHGLEAARGRVREVEQALRALGDRIAAVEDELRRASAAEAQALARCSKAARLQVVDAAAGQQRTLELSYLVSGARWVPEYELRVAEDGTRAELVAKALVTQRTGEDWEGVELAFSTADLNRSAELPELESWRIGKAQPPRKTGWRELPDTLGELFEGYDRERRELPPAALPPMPRLPQAQRLGGAKIATPPPMPAPQPPPAPMRPQGMVRAAPPPPPEPEAVFEEEVAECEDFAPQAPASAMMTEMACAPAPAPRLSRARSGAVRHDRMEKKRAAPAARFSGYKEKLELGVEGGAPGEMPAQMPAEAEPGEIGASDQALAFESLRMLGPDEGSGRGGLKAFGAAERLAEELAGAGVEGDLPAIARGLLSSARPAEVDDLPLPAHAVRVEESAGHFAVRYPAEGSGRVAADGGLHAVALLRREAPVRRVYRCVPALDDKAYQVVEFDNPLSVPLLAGAVRVYRGGDFTATTPLDTTPPGKPIAVNLGVEGGLRVARNTHFQETTGGLFGGETQLRHEVTIEVRSQLDAPARLEIFERVPVTLEDEIKVEVLKSEPAGERYEQRERGQPVKGGWRFTLELAARAVATVRLVYQITMPSKRVLVGGNRRD